MKIIDNRLLDAKSEQQLIENFNRTLGIIDTLASVVADIEDSQLFRITFDTDDGEGTYPNQYVVKAEKATAPAENPTKQGYTFEGWYNGDELFDFDTEIAENYNLKAKYTEVATTYNIKYHLSEGYFPEGMTVPYTYTANDLPLALPIPVNDMEGMNTFDGWYDEYYTEKYEALPDGTTGDIDLYAMWV